MTDTLSDLSVSSAVTADGGSLYAGMSPEGRTDVVVQLSAAIAALQAELGRAVAAVDVAGDHVTDGATDVAAWLVMATGVNRRHARQIVRVATALEGLPALRGLLASGAVAFDQVAPVTRFATPETDEDLAAQLPGWSASQVEAMARRLAPKPDDEATTARARRELHWRADHQAGGFRYRGFLPTDQAAAVNAALTALADAAGPDAESGVWDPFGARCADALHDLAVGDRHPGEASLSVLHVDAATVAHAANEAAARAAAHPASQNQDQAEAARSVPDAASYAGCGPTGGSAAPAEPDPGGEAADPCAADRGDHTAPPGPSPDLTPAPSGLPPAADGAGPEDRHAASPPPAWPLPPGPGMGPADPVAPHGVLDGAAIGRDTVLRYLCDCDIEFAVEGPNGTTVGIGRRSRAFPDWMRRHIEARDHTCRFPGCDRAIRHIHHDRHWTRDRGPTDSHNCAGLCWAHHHLVHEGHWEITGDADGTLTFTSPHGRRVTSRRQPLRPTTRGAAARITGTTLTVIPREPHAPPGPDTS